MYSRGRQVGDKQKSLELSLRVFLFECPSGLYCLSSLIMAVMPDHETLLSLLLHAGIY